MNDDASDRGYSGIGRLDYFLLKVGLGLVMAALVLHFGPESSVIRVAGFGASMTGFVLNVKRLENIGLSKWFAMLRLVPYLGSLLEIWLLSAQAGWMESRRFDRAGKRIIVLLAVLIASIIYAAMQAEMPYLELL